MVFFQESKIAERKEREMVDYERNGITYASEWMELNM